MAMSYDERKLLGRLAAIDRKAKTAFAAACAQRMLPMFGRYAEVVGDPNLSRRLDDIVSAAWDVASGGQIDVLRLQEEAESMVPSDDGDEWIEEMGYAQNAAAAAAYAIRTWSTDDPQEAAWAGRQLYEISDYAVRQSRPEIDVNAPGVETSVLESELVQLALQALESTLAAIERDPQTWDEVRAQAIADGREIADAIPS